ncbi:MAG: ATP-binding cassette domain-containing protein [Treponema sp.]|jgi:ABC-type nitrate/sulfonate/bicarbonate transport system ATPase subunit|nr:ATP-binding cassette domain-containing protein [Treponema sp.]
MTGPVYPHHPADRKMALRFDRVSFSYGPVKVLEAASFHIHQGEFIALVGPNGSGKTTILIVTHDTGFVSALTDRVLCMGNREGAGRYGIVQHRIEAAEPVSRSHSGGPVSRIIHGEDIPGDNCFKERP